MPGTMTRHHLTDRLADMVAVDLVAAVVEEEAVDGTLATSINLQHRPRRKQEDSDQGSGRAWVWEVWVHIWPHRTGTVDRQMQTPTLVLPLLTRARVPLHHHGVHHRMGLTPEEVGWDVVPHRRGRVLILHGPLLGLEALDDDSVESFFFFLCQDS